jgi:hypothetical protein
MSIEMDDPPDQMSLAALEKCCQREMLNYRKGVAYDDRYCLEIFYRALKKQDDQANELLMRSFRGMAIGWLRSHPRYDSAIRYESEDNYVVEAFARLWNARRDKTTNFESLGAALIYLKRSLLTAVQDTLRFYEKQMLQLAEPGSGSPDEPVAQEENDGHELWEVLQSFLPNEHEKALAYLMFHCNLKPREVMQHRPGMFKDVNEIYHMHRNIMDRIKRNLDQIRWRLSDGENK